VEASAHPKAAANTQSGKKGEWRMVPVIVAQTDERWRRDDGALLQGFVAGRS